MISVIVWSYNRPNYLLEALASISQEAKQVVVVDDGSDFDVEEHVRTAIQKGRVPDWEQLSFIIESRLTPEQRLHARRFGKNTNLALQSVTQQIVTYLCDDDLFTEEWLPAVRQWFTDYPEQHVCRGTFYVFEKTEDIYQKRLRPGYTDSRMLIAGNFAHRISCFRTEKIRWSETSVHSHDAQFLARLDRVHNTFAVPHIGVGACLHRDHKYNVATYCDAKDPERYLARAEQYFDGRWLESEN